MDERVSLWTIIISTASAKVKTKRAIDFFSIVVKLGFTFEVNISLVVASHWELLFLLLCFFLSGFRGWPFVLKRL